MGRVIVIGAGHNGLVAAILLARGRHDVTVLEQADVIGGACRTERPFTLAPELPASTGAYLLGPMPPELYTELALDLPLVRRDPHYFMPLLDEHGGGALLLGSDSAANHQQIATRFGTRDADAAAAMTAELAEIAADLGPAWLEPPTPLNDTADRWIRPEHRQTFLDLVAGSAMDYLARFDFRSEVLHAMYAITDGMPGLTGSPWLPGSGHNLLVHHMCRLPGADGTWMRVRGGMGVVTRALANAATNAGATIRTNAEVVALADGEVRTRSERFTADAVLMAGDPFRLPDLLGADCPSELTARLKVWADRSPGQTMKVNLALRGLPTFTAMPDDQGQHRGTTHLLPRPAADGSVFTALRQATEAAAAGRVDVEALPPIEWYFDPSLTDSAGRVSAAFFVQGVPHQPREGAWATVKTAYARRLINEAARYAPGLPDLIEDVQVLAPSDIETHFGITGGNIDHIDNAFSFTERMPYRVLDGVYAGSAACYPGGSVIGAAGHNAAKLILADLG